MSKTPIEINKELFLQIIQDLENRETFANRSKLFEAVVADYNKLKADNLKAITPPIVYLRTNEWEVELKTPKGKRGRQKGAPVPEGFGGKGKRSRKEKFAKKPWIHQNYEAIRKELRFLAAADSKDEKLLRFLPVVDRAEAGSITAMVKLNCLHCCCWQTTEIKHCNSVCAFLPVRPYQKSDAELETEQTKEAA